MDTYTEVPQRVFVELPEPTASSIERRGYGNHAAVGRNAFDALAAGLGRQDRHAGVDRWEAVRAIL